MPVVPSSGDAGLPSPDLFSATIYWAENRLSRGSVVVDPADTTSYVVLGSYTYPDLKYYTGSISVAVTQGIAATRTVNGTTVSLEPTFGYLNWFYTSVVALPNPLPPADPTINVTPSRIGGYAGVPLVQSVLGTISSPDSNFINSLTAANAVVDISWGEFSRSRGSLVRVGNQFNVVGSRTFDSPGLYPITVTVTILDPPLQRPIQFLTSASIGSPVLYETNDFGKVTGAEAGIPFEAKLSRFRVLGQYSALAQLAATIDWGDGTITPGKFVADPESPGYIVITGVHVYAKPGTYTTQVKVSNAGTSDDPEATAHRSVTVAGSRPTTASRQPVFATRNQTYTGVIATFFTTNPLATAGDFSSMIDWGDESGNTAGVITRRADNLFESTARTSIRPRRSRPTGRRAMPCRRRP